MTGLDLDADRAGLVWDADVLGKDGKWHEITLDAGNARVLNQHVDHEDDDDHAREQAAAQNAKTDAAAAARTAASHGKVTSVELDDDHGTKAAWEVETITKDGKEHKFLVDTQSGKLERRSAARRGRRRQRRRGRLTAPPDPALAHTPVGGGRCHGVAASGAQGGPMVASRLGRVRVACG